MYSITIKNMVCPRCVDTVTDILQQLSIKFVSIELGMVLLKKPLSTIEQTQLSNFLAKRGFELLSTKEKQLVNMVKTYLIEKIYYQKHQSNYKLSVSLAQYIGKDYSSISKIFSQVEGITIEKYVVYQKIERIKELLSYKQLTLAEIADELAYSSTAHLSNQFKKVTGMSPSAFKKQAAHTRKTIDNIVPPKLCKKHP